MSGTTRDAIDTDTTYHGEMITLIGGGHPAARQDRAGGREVQRAAGDEGHRPLRRQPLRSTPLKDHRPGCPHRRLPSWKAGKSVVLIVNKWDGRKDNTAHRLRRALRERFDFLPDPPMIFISALTGKRSTGAGDGAAGLRGRYARISTADINRLLRAAMQKLTAARTTRTVQLQDLLPGHRYRWRPPLFLFFVNATR
ncbi:MAG: hypothetical protein IPK19_21905 [Chloroflexi bacterium]|nr:hypothetical protein [Chloroflexota bacterium]